MTSKNILIIGRAKLFPLLNFTLIRGVSGANRGIGLNLLKAFLARSWNATGSIRPQSRNDLSIADLKEIGAEILEINYLAEDTIKNAAEAYGDKPLDILINVGGLPPHPKPWSEQSSDLMVERFRVMAVSVTLAPEWKKEGRKTTIVCFEPGFLSTRLTNWDGEDGMETSIAGLMKVIESVTSQGSSGFMKWDGTKIAFYRCYL
ncbi:hypothetical protein ACHAPA_004174 [Fusarium lateritium]